LGIGPRERYFGGEFGPAIVTNGDFTAYVCVTIDFVMASLVVGHA